MLMIAVTCLLGSLANAGEPEGDRSAGANYVTVVQVAAYPADRHGIEGYELHHHVGDEFSQTEWMAKADFEKQFVKISETTGEDAGRITDDIVDAFITKLDTNPSGNRATVTVASTVIGFDAVKTATIAETYAFDIKQSGKVSESRARAAVWELLGFVKQWSEKTISEPTPVTDTDVPESVE